jgi:hypothetical protein
VGVKFLCVLVLRYRVKRGCFWGVVCLCEGVGVKGLLKNFINLVAPISTVDFQVGVKFLCVLVLR